MKSLPKEKRDRIIFVAIGAIVILVAFWHGVISPQRKGLSAALKKGSEQASQLSNAERLMGTTTQLQGNVRVATEKLRAHEKTMASGDMYSWIIFTINRFKERYKVEIPHFSREAPTEVGMFAKFPYRAVMFHVRGNAYFHNFGNFVADFENAFPYMRVQNLELEPLFNASSPDSAGAPPDDPEKLSFRMEIVALVNPNSP
jgi:hypothetical protein